MHKHWFPTFSISDITEGQYQVTTVNFISLIIGNRNGQYFALENICTHDGGELEGGELEGAEIICPRHGAGFCINTGQVTRPPAYEDIRRFPVRIKNDVIEVEI